jgi:hypothetical protein
MGELGQGMPVADLGGSESPNRTLAGNSDINLLVFCDVLIVVVMDEIVVPDWPIDKEGGQD